MLLRKKIEKIDENLVEFFKSSGESLIRINNIEAIYQANIILKKSKTHVNKSKKKRKNLKKFENFFKPSE